MCDTVGLMCDTVGLLCVLLHEIFRLRSFHINPSTESSGGIITPASLEMMRDDISKYVYIFHECWRDIDVIFEDVIE